MEPKRRIFPIFVPHLGCPYRCVFCNQRRISGQMQPATAETVRSELERAVRVLPMGRGAEAAFYGGSFTAIPAEEQEALLGAVKPFLESGKVGSIRVSTRPDCIDPETLGRLAAFGVRTVELGVQSMCPEVLRLSGRGHTAEDVVYAARAVKDAGFFLILQMMTGLPGDTPEKSLFTARAIADLHPDGVRVYPTVIVKDTELYDLWKAGAYREHTVEDAVPLCAELAEYFDAVKIPVIRMGLNPTEELSGGAAAGGAYHPAFGELVLSRRYLLRERELLQAMKASGDVVLGVARGRVSAATGMRRCNMEALQREFGLRSLRFREADVRGLNVVPVCNRGGKRI